MPRYLFGPVSKDFSEQNLGQPTRMGECLTFNFGLDADLTIGPHDTWDSLHGRLPPDWQPDFIVLYLPYTSIPACLWSAPVPIIGLAADWNLLWHHYRSVLRRCDLVLTDAAGVEVMRREGILHARAAVLYGYGKDWEEDRGLKIEDRGLKIEGGDQKSEVRGRGTVTSDQLSVISDQLSVTSDPSCAGLRTTDYGLRTNAATSTYYSWATYIRRCNGSASSGWGDWLR